MSAAARSYSIMTSKAPAGFVLTLALLLPALAAGGPGRPPRPGAPDPTSALPNALEHWTDYRSHLLRAMEEVMGERPPDARGVPLEVRVLGETTRDSVIERRIEYRSERDGWVPAILLMPDTSHAQRPAVLCLHQSTPLGKAEPAGLAGSTDMHYALELTRRGYVTLTPDYPGTGDHRVDPYARGWASAVRKAIHDNRRAIDVLARLPQVDSTRIGCLGHSLGGTLALFTAAFDERLRAIVSSCGFSEFDAYAGGDLSGWSHRGLMPRIAERYHNDPGLMPFDFGDVIAVLAPRPVLVIAPTRDGIFDVNGVRTAVRKAEPAWRLLGAHKGLTVRHPDGYHHFTPAARAQAYEWLEQMLGEETGGRN
jgi:dienelactone hydrolase